MEEDQDTDATSAISNTNNNIVIRDVLIVGENASGTCDSEQVTTYENIFDQLKENHKHIFILSTAGKPIYSRYGNENQMASLFGLMMALVSVTQESEDSLQSIRCGHTRIVFLNKDPLILVGVSQSSEPFDRIKKQLTYVYNNVISTLTLTLVNHIFHQKNNFDLRRLIRGSERLIDNLITFTENDPGFLLNSISCLQMPSNKRNNITNILTTECSKIKNLLFGLLIAHKNIVSIVSTNGYSLQIFDIHLILNIINSSESLKTAENWTPICLPSFNSNYIMHAYISYLAEDCEACLLLLTNDHNQFISLSKVKRIITQKMRVKYCLQAINEANICPPVSLEQVKIKGLRHLLYKNKNRSQHWCPSFESPYNTDEMRQYLMSEYSLLVSQMNFPGRTLKVIFQKLTTETILAWADNDVELYMCFDPLVSNNCATSAVSKFIKWIKNNESSLFILNIPASIISHECSS